ARSSHHATLPDSHGSRTSSRWWGTRRRSSGPGLAAATSRPRYRAIESIDTISAPSRSASSMLSRVLPEPVGPVRISASWKASGLTVPPPGRKITHYTIARDPAGSFTGASGREGGHGHAGLRNVPNVHAPPGRGVRLLRAAGQPAGGVAARIAPAPGRGPRAPLPRGPRRRARPALGRPAPGRHRGDALRAGRGLRGRTTRRALPPLGPHAPLRGGRGGRARARPDRLRAARRHPGPDGHGWLRAARPGMGL